MIIINLALPLQAPHIQLLLSLTLTKNQKLLLDHQIHTIGSEQIILSHALIVRDTRQEMCCLLYEESIPTASTLKQQGTLCTAAYVRVRQPNALYFVDDALHVVEPISLSQEKMCVLDAYLASVPRHGCALLPEQLMQIAAMTQHSRMITTLFYILHHQHIGKGSLGKVYPILRCLKIDHTSLGLKANAVKIEPLVIKIQNKVYHSDDPSITPAMLDKRKSKYVILISREIQVTRQILHLNLEMAHMDFKSPGAIYAWMLMRRQPGADFFSFIQKFYLPNIYIASQFRVRLTGELFDAIQNQSTTYNIIHGDIKPENIMIDFGLAPSDLHQSLNQNYVPPYVHISLIDYAFARSYGESIIIRGGSPNYTPPETLAQLPESNQDDRVDVFSIGLVLHHIWTYNPLPDSPSESLEQSFNTFFKRNDDPLTFSLYLAINDMISKMRAPTHAHRLTLKSAKDCFHRIEQAYYETTYPVPAEAIERAKYYNPGSAVFFLESTRQTQTSQTSAMDPSEDSSATNAHDRTCV